MPSSRQGTISSWKMCPQSIWCWITQTPLPMQWSSSVMRPFSTVNWRILTKKHASITPNFKRWSKTSLKWRSPNCYPQHRKGLEVWTFRRRCRAFTHQTTTARASWWSRCIKIRTHRSKRSHTSLDKAGPSSRWFAIREQTLSITLHFLLIKKS